MCQTFKIFYACGHRDDIKAPCEWRDDGRIDSLGKRVPCENSVHNCTDLSRRCMACSSTPAQRNLVEIDSPSFGQGIKSYTFYDQGNVMETIVKNESYLRMKAMISCATQAPPISLGFPTSSEIQYQCHINEEFLARRHKRRQLQRHFKRQVGYQDFLNAAQDHFEAKNSLRDSIFSIQNAQQSPRVSVSRQEPIFQIDENRTIDSGTQTDGDEVAIAHPRHSSPPPISDFDNSNETITITLPQTSGDIECPVSSQSDNYPMLYSSWSSEGSSLSSLVRSFDSDESSVRQVLQESRDICVEMNYNPEESYHIVSREEGQETSSPLEIETWDNQEHQSDRPDQVSEHSGFIFGWSDEWEDRGMSRQDPSREKIELDSPEGIARLADIRLFLGMKPDTEPLEIWNFAKRNQDLVDNISDSVLPIRPRHIGKAKRKGFDKDVGLRLLSDFADENWEFRRGFVETWNSLNWTSEALSNLGPEEQHTIAVENNNGTHDSDCVEQNHSLSVEDDIVDDVDLDTIKFEELVKQEDGFQQDDVQDDSYRLLGRRAAISYEVDFSGRPRPQGYQARNVSRLRMSWTYTDADNVASPLNSNGEADLVPHSQALPTFPKDGSISPFSLPRNSAVSQDSEISRLALSPVPDSTHHDGTIPHLSLEGNVPDAGMEETVSSSPPQEEPPSHGVSEENNPSLPSNASSSTGSMSPRVFSRMRPPTVLPASSTCGQKLLSYVRQFLAMPASSTPQDISSYIDRHPGLMEAIRERRVPTRESVWDEKVQNSETKHSIDREVPRNLLKASTDRTQRAMQATMTMALQMLDWEEIDAEPAMFTPDSAPWEEGWAVPEQALDNAGEEDCSVWVLSTMSHAPGRREGLNRLGLMRYQVERPSPLRTTLTRRNIEVPIPAAAAIVSDTSSSAQEVWDDVDLKGEVSLPPAVE